MDSVTANIIALLLVAGTLVFLALALLWRVGVWNLSPAQVLTFDEGLRIGSMAPQVAAHRDDDDYHLDFAGVTTFLVMGTKGCRPCYQLLTAALSHPATSRARLVYISDEEPSSLDGKYGGIRKWEIYKYHDEDKARGVWRAPVSPYFHLINAQGTIIEKGIANAPEHLDRLLQLAPAAFRS